MITKLSFDKKNLQLFILAVALLAVFSTQQIIQARQSSDQGLIGNYNSGHRDGLAAGANDYRTGQSQMAVCPGGTIDYCAGFTMGYNDGYDSARKVG